ncbi:MAG: hypothetical protein WC321_05685 [Candidatus Omnitrophota bacterium]|jgi:hypothetical protein
MKWGKREITALEKNLVTVIFVIWCILAFRLVISQVRRTLDFVLPAYSFNLEEKYELIDGGFYNFAKFCEARVQERASMVFKVVPQEPAFRSPEWFTKEYLVGRLSYLLYPRKILRGQDAAGEARHAIVFDIDSQSLRLDYR